MDFYIVLGVERGARRGRHQAGVQAARPAVASGHQSGRPRGGGALSPGARRLRNVDGSGSAAPLRRRPVVGRRRRRRRGDVRLCRLRFFEPRARRAHDDVRRVVRGSAVEARRRGRPKAPSTAPTFTRARTLTFEEAWHGVQRTVTVTRQDACRACAGSGFQRVAETRCVSCEGTGAVRSVRGHMVFAKTCPTCGGEGRLKQEECAPCHGQGVEPRSETLTVRIPPAVADGARVRIAAKGHAGVRGGAPGDLLIDVSVAEHPVLPARRRRVAHDRADRGARSGARREDRHRDAGRRVRLRVPPGTQSGQRFRLRDRGVAVAHTGSAATSWSRCG